MSRHGCPTQNTCWSIAAHGVNKIMHRNVGSEVAAAHPLKFDALRTSTFLVLRLDFLLDFPILLIQTLQGQRQPLRVYDCRGGRTCSNSILREDHSNSNKRGPR